MHPGKRALAHRNDPLEPRREHARRIREYLAIDAHRALLELAIGLGIAWHQAGGYQQSRDAQAFDRHVDFVQWQIRGVALATYRRMPTCNGLFGSSRIVESRSQLARETRRLYPDEGEHRRAVAVRKGRENYLCLLNLEDALQGGFSGRAAVLAQLVARWAAYTRDGDMIGGDLPGWLPALFAPRKQ